jgi:hypothetical protein
MFMRAVLRAIYGDANLPVEPSSIRDLLIFIYRVSSEETSWEQVSRSAEIPEARRLQPLAAWARFVAANLRF